MENETVSVGRATLHLLGGTEGAPDLLLIHGFGSDRFSWSATAPAFFATHRVWAVELPGHTAAPVDAGSATTASMAAAVAEVIQGSLSLPCVAVGHSLGGAVAIELMRSRPGIISTLVAIAPACMGSKTNREFLLKFPSLDTPGEAQALLELLVSRPKLIGPHMVQHVLGFLGQPGRRDALQLIAENLSNAPALDGAQELDITAVWGIDDAINPLNDRISGIFGKRLHVMDGTGHMPHVEQARSTNKIILGAITAE